MSPKAKYSNMLVYAALGNAKVPNANGFASQWNIGLTGFWARSHTGVMDYDEACFMHLNPGVVHNFPKAVGV